MSAGYGRSHGGGPTGAASVPPRPDHPPRYSDIALDRTTETAGDFSSFAPMQHHHHTQSQQQQQQQQQMSWDQQRPGYGGGSGGFNQQDLLNVPTVDTGGGGGGGGGGSGGGASRSVAGGPVYQHWTMLIEHWHATVAYCAVFWSFGMCVAFLGPTLLDLGCQTSSDLRAVSWVFVAQLFCSLAGATVAGYLARRFDANRILLVNTTVIPICMLFIPLCKALSSLAFILAVMGINMGCIDCLANLQMINTHGIEVAPFLHALHFCYGIGAFVSPMIAEPFILNEDCSPLIDNDTSAIMAAAKELRLLAPAGAISLNDTNLPADTLIEAQEMSHVRYAFWIMALVQLPVPILVGTLSFKQRLRGWRPGHRTLTRTESNQSIPSSPNKTSSDPSSNAHQTGSAGTNFGGVSGGGATVACADSGLHQPRSFASANEYGAVGKPSEWSNGNNGQTSKLPDFLASEDRQLLAIAALTAALLFIYDGIQSSYGGFVYSYALKSVVDLKKTEGAYLNALFWGMFALGRLLSIVLATKFTPAFMLLCNIGGCSFAMTLMLFMRHNHIFLYVGTAIFGVFLSSVAPTAISLAELYIDVTPSVTSAIVVVAALGEMVCPVIVGNLFVNPGPDSFLGFEEFMCFLSVAVYAALWYIGRNTTKHRETSEGESFIWCRMCCIRQPPGGLPAQVQHVRYLRKFESCDSSNIEMNPVTGAGGGNQAGQGQGQGLQAADFNHGYRDISK